MRLMKQSAELLGGSGSVVVIKEDFEGVLVGVAIKLANDGALKPA